MGSKGRIGIERLEEISPVTSRALFACTTSNLDFFEFSPSEKFMVFRGSRALISKIFSRSLYIVQQSGVDMLNSQVIRKYIEEDGLISDYIDLEKQLQPSGFDISLKEVFEYVGSGAVDFSNKERKIADTKVLEPNAKGWYNLEPGCYMLVYNEVVKMPLDVVAIARSRSTMLRNGANMETAVWDPGYQGRSSSLLVVHNPHGIHLKRDARVAQLIFFKTKEVEHGYSGVYQNERIR